MNKFVLIALLVAGSLPSAFAALNGPRILKHGDDYQLILPPAMQQALQQWNPRFKPWLAKDYTPDARTGNLSADREAPFALIGDFNHDGIADVVIDGRDAKEDLLIGLVSDHKDFKVTIITRNPLSDPAQSPFRRDGKVLGTGLPYFLRLRREDQGKKILNDRFEIESPQSDDSEGGDCNYHWESGQFKEDCQTL